MGMRKNKETHFRSRSVVLTERDELAFSHVVREFCPTVMIYGRPIGYQGLRTIRMPNITHDTSGLVNIVIPSPGQEKKWQLNLDMGTMMAWPWCSFEIRRSWWDWTYQEKKWAFDPPLLEFATITTSFPSADPGLQPFAMKLLRLVNKITWKSTGYGLDACLWSQSGGEVRRALGAGSRVDPEENIQLNKYYDDSLWNDALPEESTMRHKRHRSGNSAIC